DKAAVMEGDLQTGETQLLAEDPAADIVGAWWDPRTSRPLAAVALANRQCWHVIDPTVREDIDFLRNRIGDAELNIVSQDLAMERLVILAARSDAAGEYLLYDRKARDLRPLFKTRSDLEGRIKTQTVLPSAETAAMLFWALFAAGQIAMRKVDGWQTLAQKLVDEPIDLAA